MIYPPPFPNSSPSVIWRAKHIPFWFQLLVWCTSTKVPNIKEPLHHRNLSSSFGAGHYSTNEAIIPVYTENVKAAVAKLRRGKILYTTGTNNWKKGMVAFIPLPYCQSENLFRFDNVMHIKSLKMSYTTYPGVPLKWTYCKEIINDTRFIFIKA